MSSLKDIKSILLSLVIVALIILGCVAIVYAGKLAYREIFKRSIKVEYYQSRLAAEVKRINTVIESAQKTPQDLAYILEFHDADDPEMKILLQSVLFNNEELYGGAIAYEPYLFNEDSLYFASYVYRQGDSVVYTHLNDPEYNYFYKDWYIIPKTLMKATWSEPYYDEGGGDMLMSTYSVPFHKFDGVKEKFYGIVTVDVSIEWLTNAVESIGEVMGGDAVLISENGTIISASEKKWIYNETIFTLASEMNLPVLRDIGRDLQSGGSGIKQIEKYGKTKDWIVFYASVETNKWGLIIFLPEKELFKK